MRQCRRHRVRFETVLGLSSCSLGCRRHCQRWHCPTAGLQSPELVLPSKVEACTDGHEFCLKSRKRVLSNCSRQTSCRGKALQRQSCCAANPPLMMTSLQSRSCHGSTCGRKQQHGTSWSYNVQRNKLAACVIPGLTTPCCFALHCLETAMLTLASTFAFLHSCLRYKWKRILSPRHGSPGTASRTLLPCSAGIHGLR